MSSNDVDGVPSWFVDEPKIKFSELDNWLGIMEIDPPRTNLDKEAMYERLLQILEKMFESKRKVSAKTIHRRRLIKDMRNIIDP